MNGDSWLRGASVAPSAHNTQPWRFSPLADGRVGVRWAPERTLPVGDPTGRDLFLGLGAAVESAYLRALAEGTTLGFASAPPDAERLVGWLVPAVTSSSPDTDDLALAAALDRRQTARGLHLPQPVPASIREALVAEAARHGRHLVIITDHLTIQQLARLSGRATAALFADAAVHAELWRWLRLDPATPGYHRDGLTADCLGLTGLLLRLAQQTMPPDRMRWLCRLGLHHVLATDTTRVARHSAAICLLTSPSLERGVLVETGRVLQRIWLLAASAGLTTHPLSALLDGATTAGPTASVFGISPPLTPPPCAGEGEM